MFKIKDGYKLELQMPETIKLFGKQTKKKKIIIDKAKNGESVQVNVKKWESVEVVEVVLVQCNLVDNQYQQKS